MVVVVVDATDGECDLDLVVAKEGRDLLDFC